MTKQEFANGMAYLATIYGQDMNSERMSAWYSLFETDSYEEFVNAAKKCALTSKFFPSIAELKEAIAEDAVGMLSADQAWDKVLYAVRRYGWCNADEAMKSLPEPVQLTVNHLGGFARICASEKLEWTRKDFIKAYDANKNREQLNYTTGTLISLADVVEKKKLLEGKA